jgi:uncharacterized glyoxalase superfamily protein PhnB
MQNPTLVPSVIYDDAPAAIDFLVKAFGFERNMVVPGPNDTIAHAQLVIRGTSAMIMLGSSATSSLGLKSPRALGGVASAIYIVIDNVDAHCQRARAAGATILREPTDEDYGGRDYSCRDPEGHLWSFGTYQPSLEPST